jgi:hypothetical protein
MRLQRLNSTRKDEERFFTTPACAKPAHAGDPGFDSGGARTPKRSGGNARRSAQNDSFSPIQGLQCQVALRLSVGAMCTHSPASSERLAGHHVIYGECLGGRILLRVFLRPGLKHTISFRRIGHNH